MGVVGDLGWEGGGGLLRPPTCNFIITYAVIFKNDVLKVGDLMRPHEYVIYVNLLAKAVYTQYFNDITLILYLKD